MILLDYVVEVFALANFNASIFVRIILLDSGSIGATFVDIDQAGFPARTNGFVQKFPRCFLITLGSQ